MSGWTDGVNGFILDVKNALNNSRCFTMRNPRSIRAAFILAMALLGLTGCGDDAPDATTEVEGFVLVEATIAEIHQAFESSEPLPHWPPSPNCHRDDGRRSGW